MRPFSRDRLSHIEETGIMSIERTDGIVKKKLYDEMEKVIKKFVSVQVSFIDFFIWRLAGQKT